MPHLARSARVSLSLRHDGCHDATCVNANASPPPSSPAAPARPADAAEAAPSGQAVVCVGSSASFDSHSPTGEQCTTRGECSSTSSTMAMRDPAPLSTPPARVAPASTAAAAAIRGVLRGPDISQPRQQSRERSAVRPKTRRRQHDTPHSQEADRRWDALSCSSSRT